MDEHDRNPDDDRDHDTDDDRSLLDKMRDSGVGVDDPNIVGDGEPSTVDEHVAEDEPPQV